MAAYDVHLHVNKSTVATEHMPNKTTVRSFIAGDPNYMGSDGGKMAVADVEVSLGDATPNGVALSPTALASLFGWTTVVQMIPQVFTDNSVAKMLWWNPEDEKIIVTAAAGGAEVAVVAAQTVTCIFIGY